MDGDYGIRCSALTKEYRIRQRREGTVSALTSLFKSQYEVVTAVADVTFSLAPGECVGLLGSNGAGKTTLLRLLTGVVAPTWGTIEVAGWRPSDHKRTFLRDITLVMGQKSQLNWDIPVIESFRLHQAIYDVSEVDYRSRMAGFVEVLGIHPYLRKPTRSLSLGERMRCEIAKALLHAPRMLFLDEPTIGLDPDVQRDLRGYLRHYCRKHHASLLLTSHNIRDIEELCPRVIALQKGTLIYDGSFRTLIERHRPRGRLHVTVGDGDSPALEAYCARRGLTLARRNDGSFAIDASEEEQDLVLSGLSEEVRVLAMSRGEARTEDVVANLYQTSRT